MSTKTITGFHNVSIRFNFNSSKEIDDMFSNVEKDFSAKNMKNGWFEFDSEQILKKYGNEFNYINDSFGNFINTDLDSETCLDIAFLDLNDDFEPADMILFYQGRLGEKNTLTYVLRNKNTDIVKVEDDLKNSTELFRAIKGELEFLEFIQNIESDVLRKFATVRKSYKMLKEDKLTVQLVQELLSDDFSNED